MLHLLRADELALAVLREEGLPAAGGVVHSFSGSAEFAKKLLALGLHLSFADRRRRFPRVSTPARGGARRAR